MKAELIKHISPRVLERAHVSYKEDIVKSALTQEWLELGESYIYKVGVLTAIDSNKCDWVTVVIGTQRNDKSEVQIIGTLHFAEGENEDIGRVLTRARELLETIHSVFED